MKLENLKLIRTKKHLSRRALGEMSGVNMNTIQALEEGITNVDNVKLSTLIALSKALKTKVIKLVDDETKKLIA